MPGESSSSSKAPMPEAMTEYELIKMHNNGVQPSDTEDRLNQFVQWRIQGYNQSKSLSDDFADDFQLFSREDFERLDKVNINGLRDCLRANGVYVKKGRFVSIAQSLADVVKEEISWPPDDVDCPPSKQPKQPQNNIPPEKQQSIPHQQPVLQSQQPYRSENTTPLLPPQPAYEQENIAPNPPAAPSPQLHRVILKNTQSATQSATQPATPPATPTVLQKATQSSTQPVTQQAEPPENTAKKKCNASSSSSNIDTSLLSTIPRLPTMPTF